MSEFAVPDIVVFGLARPEISESRPAPERIISGDPLTEARNYFTDPDGVFCAGKWRSSVGRWRVTYSEYEFCHITRGRVRIESTSGTKWEFVSGDSFVIPAGFSGVWDVLAPMTKLYVVFEPKRVAS